MTSPLKQAQMTSPCVCCLTSKSGTNSLLWLWGFGSPRGTQTHSLCPSLRMTLLNNILQHSRLSETSSKDSFVSLSPLQGRRRSQALCHQQDCHRLRLCWALQPVQLPEGAGATLSTHVPRAAQWLPQCHTSIPGICTTEAMKHAALGSSSSPSSHPRPLGSKGLLSPARPVNWAAEAKPAVCTWD